MQGLKDWWSGVLEIPGATWIIYPSLLAVLLLVAYYVLQTLRNLAIGGSGASDDHLGTFRKLRDEGLLDSEEYKRVSSLVPLPEVAGTAEDAEPQESGSEALAEAAKQVIRKAAEKRANQVPTAEFVDGNRVETDGASPATENDADHRDVDEESAES